MYILGFNGGNEPIDETSSFSNKYFYHDSAAVLLENGKVIYAIEEERLNRIKHTTKFPVNAIAECLKYKNLKFRDIKAITYFEEYLDDWIKLMIVEDPGQPYYKTPEEYLQNVFFDAFGEKVEEEKFHLVHHHRAHALSAYGLSGFKNSLCITIDGMGDYCAGKVYDVKNGKFEELSEIPLIDSLGGYYLNIIGFLGYKLFDEYKVMGLAPYGDPKRFRNTFKTFYHLCSKGEFEILEHKDINRKLFNLTTPRRKDEYFSQDHKDIAASLQESLEIIVFHMLNYYKKKTKQNNLCLAGGVAHNSTLNGKILNSGIFKNIFIQPAAHDAGCSFGSALEFYYKHIKKPEKNMLQHVFLGTDIGDNNHIAAILKGWNKFLDFKKSNNVIRETATLLAEDKVIAWVQGRSEFGPRALGNRSILADPRPFRNKERINQMVKKREGYRPFAPSVIEEDTDKYFDVDTSNKTTLNQLGYMLYVVDVKEKHRNALGAITHVNGTARIQTVSKKTNRKYWDLINSFGQLTGYPIVLNTSFNNNAEPIVNNIQDAIVCFLTTGLDYLVAGDFIVKKKEIKTDQLLKLKLSLPRHVSLHEVTSFDRNNHHKVKFYLQVTYDKDFAYEITKDMAIVIKTASGRKNRKTDNHFGDRRKAERFPIK